MNQGLSFPIDLIETHTYLYYALSLYCIFPQTFECLLCARPGERLGRCINQTSPCTGGTPCPAGWTDWRSNNLQCVKVQNLLLDIR